MSLKRAHEPCVRRTWEKMNECRWSSQFSLKPVYDLVRIHKIHGMRFSQKFNGPKVGIQRSQSGSPQSTFHIPPHSDIPHHGIFYSKYDGFAFCNNLTEEWAWTWVGRVCCGSIGVRNQCQLSSTFQSSHSGFNKPQKPKRFVTFFNICLILHN